MNTLIHPRKSFRTIFSDRLSIQDKGLFTFYFLLFLLFFPLFPSQPAALGVILFLAVWKKEERDRVLPAPCWFTWWKCKWGFRQITPWFLQLPAIPAAGGINQLLGFRKFVFCKTVAAKGQRECIHKAPWEFFPRSIFLTTFFFFFSFVCLFAFLFSFS